MIVHVADGRRPGGRKMARYFDEGVRPAGMGGARVGDDRDGFHEVGDGDLVARDGEGDGGGGGAVGD